MNTTTLISLGAALVGALVAYLGTVRKLSGKVKTSDAAQLWEESRGMREEYRSRITELNDVIERCEARIVKLEQRNDELYAENGRLGRMIEQHEETIAELRLQVHRLAGENDQLKDENKSLRVRVAELEAA